MAEGGGLLNRFFTCQEIHQKCQQTQWFQEFCPCSTTYIRGTSGRGVLVARWRILSAGGEKLLKAGSSNFSHQGPSLDAGASGVVATQSELVAELNRQLAQALQESTSGPASAAAK